LRILYFVTNFPYYSETFVAEEIKQFCDAGHEVVLCNFTWYKQEQDAFSQKILNNSKNPFVLLSAILSNLGAGKSLFFNQKTWRYILSSAAKRPAFLIKYLFMLLSLDYMVKQVREVPFDLAVSHFLFKSTLAAHLICDGINKPYHIRLHTKRSLYTDSVLRGSIKVIRQSIDLAKLKELEVPMDKKPKVKMIAIGRLVPKKGFEVLLDAMAMCEPAILAQTSLDIYGSGPLGQVLEKKIKALQLSNVITLYGMLEHAPLMRKLAEADLLIVPSVELKNDIDGVPTVIAEAMAVRTPVLATPIAGIGEMVEDNVTGFLVEPNNVALLKAKIELLVTDQKTRTSVIPEAISKVSEEYRMTLAQELSNATV
jgi:glycosyltransferase involved in cell wall biosynthesis